jgi:hypothetical protein
MSFEVDSVFFERTLDLHISVNKFQFFTFF